MLSLKFGVNLLLRNYAIFLIVFFLVASFIKGHFGIGRTKVDKSQVYHNPYLDDYEKKHQKPKKKFAKPNRNYPKIRIIINSKELSSDDIKNLKQGLIKNLSDNWFYSESKNPTSTLKIYIKRTIDEEQKIKETKKNSQYFTYIQKNTFTIAYKLYDTYGTVLIKGVLPYKPEIKAYSKESYSKSKKIARKKLFFAIGYKIANSLNPKYINVKNNIN